MTAGLLTGEEPSKRLLDQTQVDLSAGHYAAAIKEGSEAAALFRKAGDRTNEGLAMTRVGLAQLYSGNYIVALNSFTQALDIARAVHDGEGEITRMNNIGTVFYFQGRYGDALARYQEALTRLEAFPGEKWNASRRQLTVANIAILYQTLGQFERALDLYSGLLQSPQALPPREEAQLLSNVGSLRRRLGDPRKALDTYRAAQALYRKAAHRDGEIAVLNNIGIVQAMDLKDFDAAAVTFTDALRLATESDDRPRAVHARLYRGETLYRRGSLAESAIDFQMAADEATALGEREETWKALYGLARIADRNGETAKSDQWLNRAVELIEDLRTGLAVSSLRSDFLADKRDVYDLLIEHANGTVDMFRWMERSRARNLQDRIRPATLPELNAVARGLSPDTALLEYWLGNSSAAVLWISAAETGVRRWRFSRDDADAIAALPVALANPQRQDWREAIGGAAHRLLEEIPPLKQAGIRHLVIIPDGVLARLPFEALPLDGSTLLVERFSVSYLPAASLVNVAPKDREIRWPWQRTLEAFADPSPGTGDGGVELAASRAWPRLPAAAYEVSGIGRILGGRTSVHVGAEARKEFLDRTPRAPVLHFATHAFADTQNPDRSYILLAPASPTQRFDYLFLKEVNGLSLQGVELATVSACETDAGKFVRGEGVESFGRAFLAAGARSVVTSLWDVNDRLTSEMMLRFYSELTAGKSKAEALRAAKLEFLRRPATPHPAYWAAFVLNGDGVSRIPYVVAWTWLLLPLLLLAGAALLLRTRARKA